MSICHLQWTESKGLKQLWNIFGIKKEEKYAKSICCNRQDQDIENTYVGLRFYGLMSKLEDPLCLGFPRLWVLFLCNRLIILVIKWFCIFLGRFYFDTYFEVYHFIVCVLWRLRFWFSHIAWISCRSCIHGVWPELFLFSHQIVIRSELEWWGSIISPSILLLLYNSFGDEWWVMFWLCMSIFIGVYIMVFHLQLFYITKTRTKKVTNT